MHGAGVHFDVDKYLTRGYYWILCNFNHKGFVIVFYDASRWFCQSLDSFVSNVYNFHDIVDSVQSVINLFQVIQSQEIS